MTENEKAPKPQLDDEKKPQPQRKPYEAPAIEESGEFQPMNLRRLNCD